MSVVDTVSKTVPGTKFDNEFFKKEKAKVKLTKRQKLKTRSGSNIQLLIGNHSRWELRNCENVGKATND